MQRRAKAVVGPAREQVTHVDDETAFDRRRVDPCIVRDLAHLQAAHLVLPQERDAAVVSVRRDAELVFIGLRRLRRVIDHLRALHALGIARREKVLVDVEARRDRAQQMAAAFADRFVVSIERRPQLGHEVGPVVRAAQRLAREHVGIVLRQLESDAEELLVVGALRLVHGRVAERIETAMPMIDRRPPLRSRPETRRTCAPPLPPHRSRLAARHDSRCRRSRWSCRLRESRGRRVRARWHRRHARR